MVTVPFRRDRAPARPLRIDWLVALSDIERLESEWRDLERGIGERTIASTYDFVVPWYRAYRGNGAEQYGDPLLGVARSRDELVGLAPLTRWEGTLGKVPLTRIDSVGFNAETGEFLVAADRPELPATFLAELRRVVTHDVVVLHDFHTEDTTRLEHIEAAVGSRTIELDPYRWAEVDLEEGFNAYHDSKSRNFRRNVKRLAAKVAAEGAWGIDRIHGPEAAAHIDEYLERMFPVADHSWKVRSGGIMAEHHRSYYRETIRRFARRGMIDFAFLTIGGRDAAFIVGIVERGVYYDFVISYDDDFAHVSPGIHLMIELLRRLPGDGVEHVVSHGDHDYKDRWTSRWVPASRLFAFNRGARASLARWSRFRIGPRLPGPLHS